MNEPEETATLDHPHAAQAEAEAGRTEWTSEELKDMYDIRHEGEF